MPKKKWSELSTAQRGAIVVFGAAQVALKSAAYRDLHRRGDAQVRGPKAAWRFAILLNPGAVAYFVFGRVG